MDRIEPDRFDSIGDLSERILAKVGCARRARAANVLVPGPKPLHPLFRDKTGKRFGKLTVVRYAGRIGTAHAYECKCDCGGSIITRGYSLSGGATLSCGCLIDEKSGEAQYKHGLSGSPEYAILNGIKNRCQNPNVKAYPRYGGRGITVCDRWVNGEADQSAIECFIADMGRRPSKNHSIDRIDNDGPYSPENCRWATAVEQEHNKRNTKYLTFRGQRRTVHDWSRETGIPQSEIGKRIRRGWTVERALTQPLRRSPRRA